MYSEPHENISASQLLQRPAQPIYGEAAKNLIKGKTVLVTGAGGSIGSEIVRQLRRLEAGKIYCLDQDEYSLYKLQLELSGEALLTDDTIILADIKDAASISRIFATVKPDIVYHAAAHKHLPLLERSPAAAIRTNVIGTQNVVRACTEHGVKYFINISTDKAARPTSVLGMTKRLAELIAAKYSTAGTKIASVRFGNVLGSRGSFLPTLAWQVSQGMTVSVTHADVSRYFMTIPEAAALVIESSVMARNGETYILDMGTSIRIIDLIRRYVEMSGNKQPNIKFTGLRAGEKMHEELFDPSEDYVTTLHPRISKVEVGQAGSVDLSDVERLHQMADAGATVPNLHAALNEVVTGSVRQISKAS